MSITFCAARSRARFPVKYEVVVNLKTGKALGLTLPRSIFLRADEVIEFPPHRGAVGWGKVLIPEIPL
jgi:hypothetical protein